MTADELRRRLDEERIVSLSADAWAAIAGEFDVLESHETNIAGALVVVRAGDRPAAVEQPEDGTRVVRRLDDGDAVRAFVAERLADYERMWDGCGCRIDYYA